MKSRSAVRTADRSDTADHARARDGAHAPALAPPASGIAFLDQGMAGVVSAPTGGSPLETGFGPWSSSAGEAGRHAPVLQGVFPDAFNAERREQQGIKKDDVQLDHMVSQDRLRRFLATHTVLAALTADGKSKWAQTKEALAALRKAITKLPRGEHNFMSEGHLVNLPQNIVPGLANQVQGAGGDFDPQVAKKSTTGNYDRYEETALSLAQREIDAAMNTLNGLVHAAALPASSAASKKAEEYDEATDKLLADEVTKLATGFDALSQAAVPTYDAGVWYDHADKKVKKRPGEWIKDASQVAVGGTAPTARANWSHTFEFGTHALGKDKSVVLVPVTVSVDVTVPPKTWKHLYERHYLPTFAGAVEAVDTFWKTDPYVYLTSNAGTALLASELQLMLRNSFNFNKAYANLPDISDKDASETVGWSKAAKKLFFQGNPSATLTTKEPDEIGYSVEVELKSIAPQDPELAYAMLPSQLPAQ